MSSRQGRVLTKEQLQTYQKDGIVVIPNILSPQQIQSSKEDLQKTLLQHNVDIQNLAQTGHNLTQLSSTNGSGGVLDLFYPNFKLDIATDERLFRATSELWEDNYSFCEEKRISKGLVGEGEENNDDADENNSEIGDGDDDADNADSSAKEFEWMKHPYGDFDSRKGYAYIDRIGFRLPTVLAEQIGLSLKEQQAKEEEKHGLTNDTENNKNDKNHKWKRKKKTKKSKLAIQRSLTPHLDCCPDTIYSNSQPKSKWRPIQCFVSLTDNLQPNTGGFEAVRGGFHKEFHKWASTRPKTIVQTNNLNQHGDSSDVITVAPPCIGEYTHIRPKEDADIMKRIEHIPVAAGSAVFWDNRIPHANSYKNTSDSPRVVVYCSFLPDVKVNRIYARKQLEDYNFGRIPRDQWIKRDDSSVSIESKSVDKNSEVTTGENTMATYEEFCDTTYSFSTLGRKLMMIDAW